MSNNENNDNRVNEPGADYTKSSKSELKFFSSFEEMNEADAKEAAGSNPIENIKRITEYIKQVYANELKSKLTDLTIHIKTDGNTPS